MKITSRQEDKVAGSGEYTIRLTLEELQYVAALAGVTRAGASEYAKAAWKVMDTIDTLMGEDFLYQSIEDVNMYVSITDDNDKIVSQHHNTEFTIEV